MAEALAEPIVECVVCMDDIKVRKYPEDAAFFFLGEEYMHQIR